MPDKGNPCVLLDSLARAYHWSHSDIMRLTMPQIVMYSHAAYVNSENAERRAKASAARDSAEPEQTFEGKKISELNSDELSRYLDAGL